VNQYLQQKGFRPMTGLHPLVSFISRYRWLFIAPFGLLILPFIIRIIEVLILEIIQANPIVPSWDYLTYNFLWVAYKETWWFLLLPIIGGIFITILGYTGAKLKANANGAKAVKKMYSFVGGLLVFSSIGIYLLALLLLIFIATLPS
jgi:hypothetical protein